MHAVEHLALGRRPDRDLPRFAALGPGIFQHDFVSAIGKTRLEFDGLLAPRAKGLLQFETHPHVRISDLCELIPVDVPRLRHIGDQHTFWDPVMIIRGSNFMPQIHLLRPPT